MKVNDIITTNNGFKGVILAIRKPCNSTEINSYTILVTHKYCSIKIAGKVTGWVKVAKQIERNFNERFIEKTT